MSDREKPTPRLDAEAIVAVLNHHHVRYVTIGAFAALLQGAILPPTQDIDFTPDDAADNLQGLSDALRELGARIRTDAVSGGLAFYHDAESLARSGIWNLICPFGEFDLSFRPSGTEGYSDLARAARNVRVGNEDLLVASLADIIRSKQAAGRPKDLRVLPVLYEALDRQQSRGQERTTGARRPPDRPGPDLGL